MNSPDYDDFIDMFSVPTPISPLPPTPVASPSHEPSQESIYDSLPPMEQSTVPESPLKEPMEKSRVPESTLKDPVDSKPTIVSNSPHAPVKKIDSVIHFSPRSRERRNEERRNEERRNEERRPRDPRMYRRPDFRPPYRRHAFKPSVSETPLFTAINAHFPGKCPKLFPQPRNRVLITPVIRPPVFPVLIARPSTALSTPQPVIIPEPPMLTTPQILLPDPPRPPELTTPLVQIPDPPVQIPDPPV
ncbi:hypothetical protein TNCV_2043511 [Trichonephila clavipes]|nr:hypothetical protein TNCV_2043511 [Trichonephila clavipes]